MSWGRRWLDPLRSRWLQHTASRPQRPLRGPLVVQLRLDDPYSNLAVQLLPQLAGLMDPVWWPIQLDIYTEAPQDFPGGLTALDWQRYSVEDAHCLADQHHFDPPAQHHWPDPAHLAMAQQILQQTPLRDQDFLRLLQNVFHMLWQGQAGKLRTVQQLARQARTLAGTAVPEGSLLACRWVAAPLLQARYVLAGRSYLAVDDFLRLTRRLHHQQALRGEPVFLIDHVEWREHLVSDPVTLADIQARQPRLKFWGALEDPLTWILLQYIQREMAGHYNVLVEFLPLPHQQRDQFDWALLRRLSRRTGVDFAPFCRPDAAAVLLMARYLHGLDAAQRLGAALQLLEQVWTRGRCMATPWALQQGLALEGLPTLPEAASTAHWLAQHQQVVQALKLPDLPVMQLEIGGRQWRFCGLYRVWRLEVLLAQAAEW